MHLGFRWPTVTFQKPDLIRAASDLVPLSRTATGAMDALKQWASSGRAKAASGCGV